MIPCTTALALIVSCVALGDWPAGAVTVGIENWPAVICGGWKLAVTPVGAPETARVANCVKLFALASET